MSEHVLSSEEPSPLTSDEEQRKKTTDINYESGSSQETEKKLSAAQKSGDESLQESCRDMFQKISEYLQSELSASLDDYELLEKLNELTKNKYTDMDKMTNTLVERMQVINDKYAQLQPYLEMIEKVDASVSNLEQAAHKLDAYSKELEARFKKLERTASTSST